MSTAIAASLVGIPYDKEWNNCATLVCRYYRDIGYGNLPDGDLAEYTPQALLWIKNNFKRTNKIEQDCLLLIKNIDGTLHVAIFDGDKVLHNTSETGSSFRQPLHTFLADKKNRNMRIYKWRH